MSISIGKTSYGQDNLIYLGDKLVSEIYSGTDMVYSDDGLIFTIDTTFDNYNHRDSNLKTFGLPISKSLNATYNFVVYWGDGTSESRSGNGFNEIGKVEHEYNEPGIYTIKISGIYPCFNCQYDMYSEYKRNYNTNIISIEKIGNVGLENLNQSFAYCTNLINVNCSIPKITDTLDGTFRYCFSLIKTPQISDEYITLSGTFESCSNLEEITNFPASLQILQSTFKNCSKLTILPTKFPSRLQKIQSTFQGSGITEVPMIPKSVTYCQAAFAQSKLTKELTFEEGSQLAYAQWIIDGCLEYNGILDFRNCYLLGAFKVDNSSVSGILFNEAAGQFMNPQLDYENGILPISKCPNLTAESLNAMYETLPRYEQTPQWKRKISFTDVPAVSESNRILAIKRGWIIEPDAGYIYCDYKSGNDSLTESTNDTPFKTLARATEAAIGQLSGSTDVITILVKSPEQYDEAKFNAFQTNLNTLTASDKTIAISTINKTSLITTKETIEGSRFIKAEDSEDQDVLDRLGHMLTDTTNLYVADISDIIDKHYSTPTNLNSSLIQDFPKVMYGNQYCELASYPSQGMETLTSITSPSSIDFNRSFSFATSIPASSADSINAHKNELILNLITKIGNSCYQFNNNTISMSGSNIVYTPNGTTQYCTNTKASYTIFDDYDLQDYGVENGTKFKLYNVFTEVAAENRYFIDFENKKLYYYSDSFDKTRQLYVYCPGKTIKLKGKVSLQDIVFEFSAKNALQIDNFKHIEMSNCTFKDCNGIILNDTNSPSDNKYDADYNHIINDLKIEKCTFNNVENPLILNSSNKYCIIDFPEPRILQNPETGEYYVEDLGVVQNKFIINNTFVNCNQLSKAPCIEIQTSNCSIARNKFTNCYGMSIEHFGVANIIEYNEIDGALIDINGGAISSLGTRTSRGTKVRKNNIRNLPNSKDSSLIKAGIVALNDTGGNEINENTIIDCNYGIYLDGGRDNIVYKNICNNCLYGSVVLRARYDKLSNDCLEVQLDRMLLTDSNNNTIDYKDSHWLKYYGVGKDKNRPLIGVNTLFKTYEDLNAYCENNFIEENVSRSCGTLSGTDIDAVDGISLVYTSVVNNTTRVNSITGNIIE